MFRYFNTRFCLNFFNKIRLLRINRSLNPCITDLSNTYYFNKNFKPYAVSITLFATLTDYFSKKNVNDDNGEDELVQLVKKGLLEQSRRNYAKAEAYFHDAINVYDELNDNKNQNDIRRINIYLYLANLYYESHDYDKSFRLFQECLRELITRFGYKSNNESVIEISLKLSNIFAKDSSKVHDTKVGYEFCINSILTRINEYESKLSPLDDENGAKESVKRELINAKILYIIILHTYGQYLLNITEYKHALQLLEQAYVLATQFYNRGLVTGQQFGSIINDLALSYDGIGDYKKAVELMNNAIDYLNEELKSVDIELKALNPRHDPDEYKLNQQKNVELKMHKFVSLSNLCSSYYQLKQYSTAKSHCLDAIKLVNDKHVNTKSVDEYLNEIKKRLNDINKEIKKNVNE